MRLLLVFLIAALAGAAPVLAEEGDFAIIEGPTQSTSSAARSPGASRMDGYSHPERTCTFGPFTMQLDPFEVSRLAEAAPSGRDALQQIMALEEDIDLPPFTFLVATEPDGQEDVKCYD